MPDVPVPFKGTPEERAANHATHKWRGTDDGIGCFDCGCRSSDAAAGWPCGCEVPRMFVSMPERYNHRRTT